MSTPVEQIKERLSIVDVVSSYLKLDRAGSSFRARCPFHNEKTPSFFVSPARNSFYCFGCNKGGDIFTFVQEFEGLDFVGALRVLAERAGVELRRVDPRVRSQYARLYLCLEKATRFFEGQLANCAEAQKYLESRGLKVETIAEWRLGFAQNDWRRLLEHLTKEGFKSEEMEKVGLVKKSTRSDLVNRVGPSEMRWYDAFRGRIMFPIRDSAGRVIAFSARILPSLEDSPATGGGQAGVKTGKYINSSETVLFNKSEVLHGFDRAKHAIRQRDATILVEGQMDLLMSHQAGFGNTVASSGTALTEIQLQKLKRLSENLLLAFDSDSAGLRASERAIWLALSLGMNVRVIALKEKDPADLILHAPEEWTGAVERARHVIDFSLDGLLAREKEGRERALVIERELLPLVRLLPSRVEQAHFIKAIAERAGLREEALWEAFKKLPLSSARPSPVTTRPSRVESASSHSIVARRVFAVLFLAEARGDEELIKRLTEKLTSILGMEKFGRGKAAFATLREPLLAEAEAFYGEGLPTAPEEAELLRNLEEEELRLQLQAVTEELTRGTPGRQGREPDALLRQAKQLSERLAALKSLRFSTL